MGSNIKSHLSETLLARLANWFDRHPDESPDAVHVHWMTGVGRRDRTSWLSPLDVLLAYSMGTLFKLASLRHGEIHCTLISEEKIMQAWERDSTENTEVGSYELF
jgi:hypothetical protein